MKLTEQEKQEISQKNDRLESIKPILKQEFFGIDDQIDQILDYMRPFYIFPKSLKRPIVVNLFGLTGVGKTVLIDRIVSLLELQYKFYKFDIGDYTTVTSEWKMKNEISGKAGKNEDKNIICVFDEFQFGRTINEKGEEVDRMALRPMWEMIDSGVISVAQPDGFKVYELIMKFEKMNNIGIVVENGIVTEGIDQFLSIIYKNLPSYDKSKPVNYRKLSKEVIEYHKKVNYYPGVHYKPYTNKKFQEPFAITEEMFNILYEINSDFFNNIKDITKHRKLFEKSIPQLIDLIFQEFIRNSSLMVKKDFSQSIIFVVGNIDEAYTMTHNSDPDADADIYYEFSKKITVPQMKKALSSRYRMEQISRLGNNIVVYPSLDSNSYKKIIDRHLQQRIENFDVEFGIKLNFTENLKNIIYKESVFPTQGARPILSSFSSFIDSYITKIISDIIFKYPDAENITWDFDLKNPRHVINLENDIQLRYPVKLQVENLRKSDSSEKQLYTAVHESGHAIISIVACKLIPKTIMSKTASADTLGFCHTEKPELFTKKFLYNTILLSFGGREAELAVFGHENISLSATSDLENITKNAVSMIKSYGFGSVSFQTQHDPNNISHSVYSDNIANDAEMQAIKIVEEAQSEARQIIETHLDKVLELSEILSENSKIEYDELQKLVDKWGLEYRDKDNYYDFKSIFERKKLECANSRKVKCSSNKIRNKKSKLVQTKLQKA